MSKNMHQILKMLKENSNILEISIREHGLYVVNIHDADVYNDIVENAIETLDIDEVIIETPESFFLFPAEIHLDMIYQWICSGAKIQFYNKFRHPDDKWEDCSDDIYWDITTRYRIKPQ